MKTRRASFGFITLLTVLWLASPLVLSAQTNPSSSTQVAASAQSGKEAVCDGALEIIPSGTMAFTRKRYVPSARKAKSQLAKPRSPKRK